MIMTTCFSMVQEGREGREVDEGEETFKLSARICQETTATA